MSLDPKGIKKLIEELTNLEEYEEKVLFYTNLSDTT